MSNKTAVEPNIARRQNGKLYVTVQIGSKTVHESCDTLAEARKARDRLIAQRIQQAAPKADTGKRKWVCTVLLQNGTKAKREYTSRGQGAAANTAKNKSDVVRVLYTEAAA